MAIKITIGGGKKEAPPQPAPKVAEIKLNISKAVNGDYYIKDHSDIDIVVMVEKNKVLALSKDLMSEMVYGAQDTNKRAGFNSEGSFPKNISTKGGVLKKESEELLNRFFKKKRNNNNLKLN